jgi:epoxyqueuosine reductase
LKVHLQVSEAAAIKALARDAAIRLGASDVRVAPASDSGELRAALRASFARGDFATWPYDDAYAVKASDPAHVLAGARCVICIAVPYSADAPGSLPLHGRVSSYVGAGDYHHRVKDLLRDVARRIDEAAGASVTAVACDTKPIAERAFAARAGLGWIGKHTNLISPVSGSFVFLGEIVTTLDLPADPPLRKTCGACTRCIPACPTGALRGDYTIDATRCIADLTQRTDAIPLDLRPLIGTWVWGCDLCQAVCPPNKAAPRVAASEDTALPQLVRLLRMRSSEFKKKYARSAMGWRGAAILRRNAAVALGNTLDRAGVPALADALHHDPHALVRGHAAWALGRIGSPAAIAALRRRCATEANESVLQEISAALEPFAAPAR